MFQLYLSRTSHLRGHANLLSDVVKGWKVMPQQRLILAIERIERALSRLERIELPGSSAPVDPDLRDKHEQLKAETQAAIREIDALLGGVAN